MWNQHEAIRFMSHLPLCLPNSKNGGEKKAPGKRTEVVRSGSASCVIVENSVNLTMPALRL